MQNKRINYHSESYGIYNESDPEKSKDNFNDSFKLKSQFRWTMILRRGVRV